MQMIYVHGTAYEFPHDAVNWLNQQDAIYWCDEHEGWHLNPEHEFNSVEVEVLMSQDLEISLKGVAT